jgi:uncharacterized membrane protein YjjB (DUF3815 family)
VAELVELPGADVLQDTHTNLLGWWAPWLGVGVFDVATAPYLSAPGGTLHWLLVVLLAAWVGQVIGGALVGANVIGFFGAMNDDPHRARRLPPARGQPSQVTFLHAFWLLVPGAMGLISVTEIDGNPATAGLENLIQPVASIVAIALGVLCGASAYRSLAAVARRRSPERPDLDAMTDQQPTTWSASGTPVVPAEPDVLRIRSKGCTRP